MAIPSGTAGRVKAHTSTTTVTLATIKSWKLTKTTTPVPVPTFESPTQGNLTYPEVLAGLSQATLTIEGFYDIGAGPVGLDASISNGNFYYLDLLFTKSSAFGFDNVYALCTNVSAGQNVENQAASFTAEFTTSGVVPLSGASS